MSIQGILDYLQAHPGLVEIVLFILAFGESLVLVSFLIPSTVLFLGIGALHEAAGGSFLPIFMAGAAGAFLGDVASFWIGWYLKDDLPNRWPFRKNPKWLGDATAFVHKWGVWSLILSKFMGPFRSIAPAVAGVLGMQQPKFLAATAVASILWSLVLLAPPYYGLKAMGF